MPSCDMEPSNALTAHVVTVALDQEQINRMEMRARKVHPSFRTSQPQADVEVS